MDYTSLRSRIYSDILNLATEDGINASGKDEIYGCIFGRDSAITILKILKVISHANAANYYNVLQLQEMCRRALINLTTLQGKETVFESGEQPGKFIHEYRKDKYDHLLTWDKPWFVYPDGILRNYDSLDSTPLALIAIYRYWEQSHDDAFLLSVLPSVEAGLNWIITYGDLDKDGLVEYELPKDRPFGGLPVQSWTDSHQSISSLDGKMPPYPIAPVEVQGYTWLALKLWADFYETKQVGSSHKFSIKLRKFADSMKDQFNNLFLFEDKGFLFPAQALDGIKNQLKTVTGNPLLLLWATYSKDGEKESILKDEYIEQLVKRSFMPDLFDVDAGIRTMSTTSPTFDASENSYHNGSYWPKLNGMSHEGLMHWGYDIEATLLKEASLKPIAFFNSPVELYMKDGNDGYKVFSGNGQTGCLVQAWSAAATLDLLTQ